MMLKHYSCLWLIVLAALSGLAAAAETDAPVAGAFQWERLPDVPQPLGLGGPFAGVSHGALIVAGGANFPRGMPWEGGAKVWHDRVDVLPRPDAKWQSGTLRLPRPLGYGVSLSVEEGVACLGGGDAEKHYADAFMLRWDGDSEQVSVRPLPSLPRPVAFACGAVLGRTIYVAGGLESPNAQAAMKTFWALDLDQPEQSQKWRELEPWPGPGRMLAVAGAQDGAFFLVSGADLAPDSTTGRAKRTYLTDGYRYTPGKGWRAIAPVPRPVVAAPSPAAALGQSHLAVFGGDDGAAYTPAAQPTHPGFSADVLAYHTITDTWRVIARTPAPRVTAPLVAWQGGFVVPSGEVRAGVRSPRIDLARPAPQRAAWGWANSATLVLYLVGMVALGSWFARRNKNTDDFFRGGQRIPWWAAGLSIYATVLSSITYMAIPAKTFATDWSYYFMALAIVAVAPVVVWFYLPVFRQLDVTTAYEYLEKRFNLAIRWFGSISFILFQFGRMAIVLYLPALALATVSSLDIYLCIVVMGALCVLYTMLGGMEAVVWTDVVQTIVLLGGLFCALAICIAGIDGGFTQLWRTAHQEAKVFENLDWSWDLTAATVWVTLVGNFFANLMQYTASQDVVQRYITTSDQRKAARSVWTNAAMILPSMALFFMMGTALFAFYKTHPDRLDPNLATDGIFPLFIVREMPAGLGGLVVAAIFAAAQSTLSGSLNSVAACWVTDFHRRLKPGSSEAASLRLARGVTLVVGIAVTLIACLLARINVISLWDGFISILGLTGGALAALFALGIFTRRANSAGVMLGALASVAVLYYVQQYTTIHIFLYGAIGVAVCFAVGWGASWLVGRAPLDLTGLTIYTMMRQGAGK